MKLILNKSKQGDRGQGKALRMQSQENKTVAKESKIKNNCCEEKDIFIALAITRW